MDEPRRDRYTTDDVMRATEPVVAPVTAENDIPIREEPMPERRVVDERPVAAPAAPAYERTRTVGYDEPRGFSFLDSFLGWNIAAFWMLVFMGIVLAALGSSAYNAGATPTGTGFTIPNLANLAWAGTLGLVVAQFLAYLIGGYGAGRMARGSGVANGLGVAVWGLVIAVVLGVIAYAVGSSFNWGYWASFYGVNFGNWTGQVWTGIVLTLVAMFLGGILGGLLGSRPYERRYEETRETRGTYRRGRPL